MANKVSVPDISTNGWPIWTGGSTIPYDIVENRAKEVETLSTDLLGKTNDVLGKIVSALNELGWPSVAGFSWTDLAPSLIDAMTLLAAYQPAKLPTPVLPPLQIPSDPNMKSINPQFPAAPSNPFNYVEPEQYWSTLADAIKNKLLSDIQNGGTGFSDAQRAAIYQRGRDELLYEYEQEYNKASEVNAGFHLLPASRQARLDEITAKYQRNLANFNWETTNKDAELALSNYHWSIERGAQWEEVAWRMYDARANRTLEAAKAAVGSCEAFYKILIEIENAKADLTLKGNEAELKIFLARIGVNKAIIEQNVELYKLYGVYTDAETKIFESYSRVLAQQQDSQTKIFQAQIDEQKAKADLTIKEADLLMQRYMQRYQTNFEALNALGSVYAQLTASIFGALHVTAGISASSGLSIGQTRSLGESISAGQSISLSIDPTK